jgi:enoyl-CoA hydratase
MSEAVLTQAQDGVLRVTVNRPAAMNALDGAVLDGLASVAAALRDDPALRVAVIAGAGDKAFVAGGDIVEMQAYGPAEAEALSRRTRAVYAALRACPKPVIAAIDGLCLGGGLELAIACDLRLASDRSSFGLPEVKLGILPGGGGTARLARLIGLAAAKRLALTGQTIDAAEARRLNLVDAVEPVDTWQASVDAMAARLAAMSPAALARIKGLFALMAADGIEAADDAEVQAFALAFASADQKEGMAAFVEKRKPRFEGR